MSLSERSRSVLFRELSSMVGDEDAVGEMMSYFPARDVEEPVTKEHLRAELVTFRSEVAAEFGATRHEMATEFAAVRGEMATEFAAVRSEMATEFAAVRGEMATEFAAVRSEMASEFAAVRGEMATEFAAVRAEVVHSTRWAVGALLAAMVALNGAWVGLIAAMG
jgi:hypothetical protein